MATTSTLVDRVKIFVESSGTGPFELGNAVPAFRGVEALADGLTYSYAVESGADFEAGQGVYVLAVNQLLRTPAISSAGGAPVAFPANVAVNFTALAVDLTATRAGTGTVTSVNVSGGATGLNFTGGPIEGAGTLTMDGTLGVANGGTGANTLAGVKTAIGLGNVDNTSDADKPISTAQQTALDSKVDTTALIAATGGALVGFKQDDVDAVLRTSLAKMQETVSVTDWPGVVGDGTTDCTAGIAMAREYVATTGANLRFPPGIYIITESPNWAIGGATIFADGDVTIRSTGTGHAILIDGEAPDAVNVGSEGIYGLTLTGFKVEADPAGDVPVLIRAVHNFSNIALHVRGGNPTKEAFRLEFCVSPNLWLACHALDTGTWYMGSIPLQGIYLTHNGNPAKPVSYAQFNNLQVAGVGIGMFQAHALGVALNGGALQGCTDTGLYLAVGAVLGKINDIDLEVNPVDIVCIGQNNVFSNVDTETLLHVIGGANNRIVGGTHAGITIDSGSVGNSIENVRYGRNNPDGSPSGGIITDNGTRTRMRDNLHMPTQKYANVALTEIVQTVGASPFSYVNASANSVTLLVTGGTVSTIDYGPQNVVGRLTGQTSGMFRLRPGDSLIIAFSVAPSVYLYQE